MGVLDGLIRNVDFRKDGSRLRHAPTGVPNTVKRDGEVIPIKSKKRKKRRKAKAKAKTVRTDYILTDKQMLMAIKMRRKHVFAWRAINRALGHPFDDDHANTLLPAEVKRWLRDHGKDPKAIQTGSGCRLTPSEMAIARELREGGMEWEEVARRINSPLSWRSMALEVDAWEHYQKRGKRGGKL